MEWSDVRCVGGIDDVVDGERQYIRTVCTLYVCMCVVCEVYVVQG